MTTNNTDKSVQPPEIMVTPPGETGEVKPAGAAEHKPPAMVTPLTETNEVKPAVAVMPDVPETGTFPRTKPPPKKKVHSDTDRTKMVQPLAVPPINTGVIHDMTYQEFLQTAEAATNFRKFLCRTVDQIDAGFRSTMIMYQVAFYLGVILILASFGAFIVFRESILSAALGGLGIADFITFFVTRPPQNLQRSRADLAQLQATFYNWFTEVSNLNLFLSNLKFDGPEDLAILREVTKEMRESTAAAVMLIEKYCETGEVVRSPKPGSAATQPPAPPR